MGARTVLAALAAAAAALPAFAQPDPGLDPAKALTQYGLDCWATDDGLPNSTVNSVLQTRDGYLWVGTYDGLARFDGVRFTVFSVGDTPGLEHNGIRALAEDADGALWVGTNGGGVSVYRDGQFRALTTTDGLPSNIVWSLAADPRGGMWIGTNGGGVARARGGRLETFPVERTGHVVGALRVDDEGALWVGTVGEGVRRLGSDDAWSAWSPADLGAPSVSTILAGRGEVLLGTVGRGLVRKEGGRFVPVPAVEPRNVSALHRDQRGTLWVGTNGHGLWRLTSSGSADVLDLARGLPTDLVFSVGEDREGGLWLGLNGGGLCRLRDGSFTTWTTREGLPHDFVYGMQGGPDGTVWMGTAHGLARLVGGRAQAVAMPGGDLPVRSVAADADGTLWVATYGGGLHRLSAGRWTRWTVADGLPSDYVRAILHARDGRVWVATQAGLGLYADGRWTRFTRRDGLPRDSLICLQEARDGTLWIGTDGGGLVRFRDGRMTTLTTRDGLASDLVLALAEDDEGTLWVGANGGLTQIREGRVTSFSRRTGLPSDAVSQILDDGRGNLWIGTSRGVSRIAKVDLEAVASFRARRLDVLTLGRTDGLRSTQCSAPAQPPGWRDGEGRLYFSTTRGLARVDPAHLRLDTTPPPVVLEGVRAGDEVLPAQGPLRVRPGVQRLEVRYTALSLLAPDRIRFRYRLDGFDGSWVDGGDDRVARYTGLPPGDYVFRVDALKAPGPWAGTGPTLAIRLQPHLWEEKGFLAGVALLAGGLVVGVHRLRVQHLQRRKQELEALVAERTHRLAEEKLRAEEAVARAEAAHALKSELLEVAAHDLKNPLQVVQGFAEVLAGQVPPASPAAEMTGAIQRSAERMLGLIEALLTHAALEAGAIELRRQPLDLTATVAAAVERHRPHAERKRQRLEIASAGLVPLSADPGRLAQVLDNLISNAVKYSPPGATVSVHVAAAGGWARVSVRDEGPGLSGDDMAGLFRRFHKLSARPTGGEGSTGLGLSIVRRLVDLHGGRVWAESAGPGRGSTFIVELAGI